MSQCKKLGQKIVLTYSQYPEIIQFLVQLNIKIVPLTKNSSNVSIIIGFCWVKPLSWPSPADRSSNQLKKNNSNEPINCLDEMFK